MNPTQNPTSGPAPGATAARTPNTLVTPGASPDMTLAAKPTLDPISTRIAVGPLLYYWPRQATLDFYAHLADSPAEIVYLGETVCSRRHELRLDDWLDVAAMLADAGKTAVMSSQALIESESDLKTLRRIVAQADFRVEANDMSAVRLLGEAGRKDWIAGPTLNIFNPATLGLMMEAGATRWVVAPEMSGGAMSALLAEMPARPETEVLAWGRLPLAHSARCFTARHFNLQKDTCEFRCLGMSDGIVLHTREGEPFLTLNGVQTQSARVHNLIADMAQVAHHADIVRISPQGAHTLDVVALFREVLDGRTGADEAFQRSTEWMVERACNGFWHGKPGLEYHAPGCA